jgi:hypothetical protein
MIDEGDISSIICKMSLRGPKFMRKVDGLILIFIDFYVPVLTPRLNSTETSLQLSENITLFAICHQQRDLDGHQVFGVYHLYYTLQCGGQDGIFGTPACTSLDVDISPSTESLIFSEKE